MTIADAWPTTSRAFTVEDLDQTPDDGFRYELIDGVLIVSPHPRLLVVEIESPSSALFDLNTKKAVYERFSIESYWVVVPDVDQPELIAFGLRDGRYEQVAHVTGGKPFRAERPFPVEVVPARLVAGLLPD